MQNSTALKNTTYNSITCQTQGWQNKLNSLIVWLQIMYICNIQKLTSCKQINSERVSRFACIFVSIDKWFSIIVQPLIQTSIWESVYLWRQSDKESLWSELEDGGGTQGHLGRHWHSLTTVNISNIKLEISYLLF